MHLIEAQQYKSVLLTHIATAKKSIHLKAMNFQLRRAEGSTVVPDESINEIFSALIERKISEPSIDIHLKVDNKTMLPSRKRGQDYREKQQKLDELRRAGIYVTVAKRNPLEGVMTSLPVIGKYASKVLRDHRKVAIFDHENAFIGGVNLTSEDLSRTDVMASISASEGSGSERLINALERYVFNDSSGLGDIRVRINDSGNTEVIADSGFPGRSEIENEAHRIISDAEAGDSIYLSSGYFPNGRISRQLKLAALRGINVTILASQEDIVKEEPDIARGIRRGKTRLASIHNLQVVQIGDWVHAKVILRTNTSKGINLDRVIIGSHNWDIWGIIAGTKEAAIVTSDPVLITETQEFFNRVLGRASN